MNKIEKEKMREIYRWVVTYEVNVEWMNKSKIAKRDIDILKYGKIERPKKL